MRRMRRRLVALAAIGLALVLATAAAAATFTPSLGSPNDKRIHTGAISLKVKAPNAKNVDVWVNRSHRLKHGALVECIQSQKGCAVEEMKPWKHHPGWFIYTAPRFSFSGYWATTPGRYYWQAESFAKVPPCQYVTNGNCTFLTRIGHFNVTG